ncbi:hypothetical protein LCI18_014458 [Fusarium solani-melongenae]|uniref:Uncharacterized protein n=1 Tax=Fusarium solani subsp. cucurbitae TaxID=2747967 RepID=A0ACD3ZQ97_FUSSC|nr:hypothetical protein LCI18_014458 [Fusarium solani-melongenae]
MPAPDPIARNVFHTDLSAWDQLHHHCIESDPAFGTADALLWLQKLVPRPALGASHCHLSLAIGLVPDYPVPVTPLVRCIYLYRSELLEAENRNPAITELARLLNCTYWDRRMRRAASECGISFEFEF